MVSNSCTEIEHPKVRKQSQVLPQEVCKRAELDSVSKPLLVSFRLSKKAKTRLKLIFSLAMFASLFVFGKVDLSKSWEVALKANGWFLLIAAALFLGSTVLNAQRWQMLADAVGLRKPLIQLVQYCYVGLFFNLFLPSTVGGDFSRGYYLSKGTGKYKNAFYSVLADRTVGISVLFLFATLGIILGPSNASEGLAFHLKLPIFIGTVGLFGIIPFVPHLCKVILGEKNWFTRRFNNSAVQVYWKDKKLMFWAVALSIALQTVIVLCHIAIGWALGLTDIPLWYYFVFYPCVAVLGFVTPSFNGIGIREWAYTYFLTRVSSVDNSHALTYAIMWLGLTTLSSLVGGLVYVAGHFKISPEEAEQITHEEL
ncbi:MAG TPA: lysylphosphatidylglycerol synthase transmembrane domain-containing protein [Candidatus Obscuribacterales bacterium]